MPNPISNFSYRTELFSPTTLDIAMNKPDVAIQIIKQYSDQFKHTVGLDLSLMGAEVGIGAETHSAFVEGRFWSVITAMDSPAASAPGGTQDITIDVDASNRFFPKVGNIIMYEGAGNITGSIVAVDVAVPASPVITVQAAAGVTLPAVTATHEIAIITSAWGEGTGQPNSSVKLYDRLDYQLQIIKDAKGWTGSQLTNNAWVDVSEYGTGFDWYNVGMADLDAAQYRLEENALLLGSGGTYTVASTTGLVDAEGDGTYTETKGIMPWIRERGHIDSTVTATNWDITDLDDVDDYLKTQGDVSPIVLGYVGGLLARRISSQLGTLQGFGRDATNTLSQYIGGQGYDAVAAHSRAVNMSFMEYQNINRTYAFREIASFSDSTGLGAANYNFNQYSIWLPMANITDGKSGAKMPLVSILYKELGGYSRRREMFTIAGAGGNSASYNSEIDKKKINMRSHIGLAFHKPNLGYMTTAGE